MQDPLHRTAVELEAGLDHIRQSPTNHGTLEMIVARPRENERTVLEAGQLDLDEGLIGDCWKATSGRYSYDGNPDPETQINIMNARVAALVAQSKERWQLAGDQLYVDLDLSEANTPPGTQLQIGEAILEITPAPHAPCKKFAARFGVEAMKFLLTDVGKQLHLRGLNARIVRPGCVRVGDAVTSGGVSGNSR